MTTLKFEDTTNLMLSEDYKDRFVAEYIQTKIRYERLKAFNNKIEACYHTSYPRRLEEPKHDCSSELLVKQQQIMGEYLHILEVRAVIENITLPM